MKLGHSLPDALHHPGALVAQNHGEDPLRIGAAEGVGVGVADPCSHDLEIDTSKLMCSFSSLGTCVCVFVCVSVCVCWIQPSTRPWTTRPRWSLFKAKMMQRKRASLAPSLTPPLLKMSTEDALKLYSNTDHKSYSSPKCTSDLRHAEVNRQAGYFMALLLSLEHYIKQIHLRNQLDSLP